jgi:G3E family GTPase
VAETRDLTNFLDIPTLKNRFAVKANLCVVDAGNFVKTAPYMQAARRQVEWADGLVINKIDQIGMMDLKKLKTLLTSMNAAAAQIEVTHGSIPDEFLENLVHKPRSGDALQAVPESLIAISFSVNKPLKQALFEQLVEKLVANILRLKGFIDFGEGMQYVEFVDNRLIQRPVGSTDAAYQGFTVIVWQLSRTELVRHFAPLFT